MKEVSIVEPYYKAHIATMKGRCENCGCFIFCPNEWQKYAAQCHILRKDKNWFPEVAVVYENHWEGCLACHNTFDDAPDRLVGKMVIIPILRERLQKFIHLIDENHISKIPYYLLNDSQTENHPMAN